MGHLFEYLKLSHLFLKTCFIKTQQKFKIYIYIYLNIYKDRNESV